MGLVAPGPRIAVALAVISFVAGAGCSALRSVKESQSTSAQARLAADPARVYGASLAALPDFHLIATADYAAAGLVEARGDWGSPAEGIFVQISVRADGDSTVLVVEAGRSTGRSRDEMREFARAVRDRVAALLSQATAPAS